MIRWERHVNVLHNLKYNDVSIVWDVFRYLNRFLNRVMVLQSGSGSISGQNERELQMAQMTAWINETIAERRDPLIIAGDLNVRFRNDPTGKNV